MFGWLFRVLGLKAASRPLPAQQAVLSQPTLFRGSVPLSHQGKREPASGLPQRSSGRSAGVGGPLAGRQVGGAGRPRRSRDREDDDDGFARTQIFASGAGASGGVAFDDNADLPMPFRSSGGTPWNTDTRSPACRDVDGGALARPAADVCRSDGLNTAQPGDVPATDGGMN